jgi:Raf kinase inhibitor-like YbhB/YbcL family protein
MRLAAVASALLALAACGGGESGSTVDEGPTAPGFAFTGASEVAEGESIGARFTCDGDDVSPALAWKGVPGDARQLALVLEDPDAPGGTFTHWLVYAIEPSAEGLAGGISREAPVRQGLNDFDEIGYGGPCPPEGEEHQYVFRLLALDAPIDLEQGADGPAFDQAVSPHVLAETRLTAGYRRE